jgi:hypothetical protein
VGERHEAVTTARECFCQRFEVVGVQRVGVEQQHLANLTAGHAPRDVLEEREDLDHVAQIVRGDPRGGRGIAGA